MLQGLCRCERAVISAGLSSAPPCADLLLLLLLLLLLDLDLDRLRDRDLSLMSSLGAPNWSSPVIRPGVTIRVRGWGRERREGKGEEERGGPALNRGSLY